MNGCTIPLLIILTLLSSCKVVCDTAKWNIIKGTRIKSYVDRTWDRTECTLEFGERFEK